MLSLESIAATALLINVFLAARANIFNFLFGAIGVSLYFVVFFNAKLYADMSLQLVYLALQFIGAYDWLYGGKKHTALNITRTSKKIWIYIVIATVLLCGLLAYILSHYTDSTTVKIDALTTAMSLVAQWMMNRKFLENWLLWMAVDIISINMYIIKNLYLTSGLYFIFFLICVMGYLNWRRELLSFSPARQ